MEKDILTKRNCAHTFVVINCIFFPPSLSLSLSLFFSFPISPISFRNSFSILFLFFRRFTNTFSSYFLSQFQCLIHLVFIFRNIRVRFVVYMIASNDERAKW